MKWQKKLDGIKPEKSDLSGVLNHITSKSDEINKNISNVKSPEARDLTENFKNIELALKSQITQISDDVSAKYGAIKSEISKFLNFFNKLDSIIFRINELKDISKGSDLSSKERDVMIREETNKILAEMRDFKKTYSNLTNAPAKDMMMLLGHRIK